MKKLKILLLFSLIFSCYRLCFTTFSEKEIEKKGIIKEKKEYDTYFIYVVGFIDKYEVITNKNLEIGDVILISGKREIPKKNTNFYLFNYQKYLRSKNIFYQIKNPKIEVLRKNNSNIYQLRNKIEQRIECFKKKEYFYLFLKGENKLEKDFTSLISSLGIMHLFVLSGMHIDLFIRLLKKKYRILFFLFFYYFLILPSFSIQRAIFGEAIYQMSNKRLKKRNITVLLFLINFIYNPFVIYHFGFQVSYLLSYFLTSKSKNYVIKTLETSMQSFLYTLPLCINQFFCVNLLTPIYNLFYIPFVTLLYPFVLLTFCIPILEPICNLFFEILENSIYLLGSLKVSQISFSYLSIFPFLILYFLIFLFIKKKRYGIYLLLFLLFYYNIAFFKPFTVTFLDVSQGDSILLQKKTEAILIDTGGKYGVNLSEKILIPSIKARGIHKINTLILTHGDLDHMGEAINLVNNFKVKQVIFNSDNFNDLEGELIKVLNKKKIKYYQGLKELNIGGGTLYFLNTKGYDNENDNSNVIYVKQNNYQFLFMGDAGIKKEKDILEKYKLSDIDFIKIGHHGSNTSSSKYFISKIKPKNCMISVGAKNRYGHPKEDVLNILDDYCNIYRTDLNGSIEIKINKNGYKIKTCSR